MDNGQGNSNDQKLPAAGVTEVTEERSPETLDQELDRMGEHFPALADHIRRSLKFFR